MNVTHLGVEAISKPWTTFRAIAAGRIRLKVTTEERGVPAGTGVGIVSSWIRPYGLKSW